jgi:hypothetical protein
MRKANKILLAGLGFTALVGWQLAAVEPDDDGPRLLRGYHHTEPWAEATNSTAAGGNVNATRGLVAVPTGSVPMSSYSFTSSKDGKVYSGVIVGTSPFSAPAATTISTVVVPLKITIGTSVFDPTAANSCDGGISAVNRFNNSPLVQSVPLTFNGVSVGTTQFIDGFRRAEFWNTIGGSAGYHNTLSPVVTAATYSLTAGSNGTTYSSGCSQLGIVSYSWISSQLTNTVLPALTKTSVVSPSKFVVFLVSNVVQSNANPPSVNNCCILGFHGATGATPQTYGIMDWDTTGDFGAGVADGSISSHEIGEWIDDPLGTNPTPAWGGIGQVSGCQTNWEVGDPLSGSLMPGITLNGKTYHMQELGFFSWYFNKLGSASVGTGGKFSSNGKFAGPSKACPPGGTN